MKSLFAIRSKTKVALTLLSMIILLLCGVLLEKYFLSKVNEASASIYEDRLIPSTAIYHLSDHIAERRLLLKDESTPQTEIELKLSWHHHKEDSVINAFEQTFLVKDESEAIANLKAYINRYNQIEHSLITGNGVSNTTKLDVQYDHIREELLKLSDIQTRVGQKLQNESKRLTLNANTISQVQVVILIFTCLIAQGFVLASKSIIPALKQKHKWN